MENHNRSASYLSTLSYPESAILWILSDHGGISISPLKTGQVQGDCISGFRTFKGFFYYIYVQ